MKMNRTNKKSLILLNEARVENKPGRNNPTTSGTAIKEQDHLQRANISWMGSEENGITGMMCCQGWDF